MLDFIYDISEIVVKVHFNCFANLILENVELVKFFDTFSYYEVELSNGLCVGDVDYNLNVKFAISS